MEECGEQVVSGDMKSSGDKCSRPAGRQQKSPLNETVASDFTTSTPTWGEGGVGWGVGAEGAEQQTHTVSSELTPTLDRTALIQPDRRFTVTSGNEFSK